MLQCDKCCKIRGIGLITYKPSPPTVVNCGVAGMLQIRLIGGLGPPKNGVGESRCCVRESEFVAVSVGAQSA